MDGYNDAGDFRDYRAQRELRRTQRDERIYAEEDKPKKDEPMLGIILTQAIICAAAFLLLLGIMKIAPSAFGQIKLAYDRVMQRDISASEAIAAFRGFVGGYAATATDSDYQKTSTVKVSSAGGRDFEVLTAEQTDDLIDELERLNFRVPVQGRITCEFGYRIHPITGNRSFHTGIDIGADEGDKITAPLDATVRETGSSEELGNYILLDHGGGIQTFYGHCEELFVSGGEVIRAGETIALVGSTGWSTGPHLHFEIRLCGAFCDPLGVIAPNDV